MDKHEKMAEAIMRVLAGASYDDAEQALIIVRYRLLKEYSVVVEQPHVLPGNV